MYKRILLVLLVVASATASFGSVDKALDDSPNFCQGCRSIVSFLHTFNSTEQQPQYKQVFDDFCKLYYPSSTDFQSGPCKYAVDGLFFMINKLDPVLHCDKIGACSTDIGPAVRTSQSAGPPEFFCELCESAINQFKRQIEDPEFVQQLRKQIEALCDYLKAIGEKDRCNHSLMSNLDALLDFVKHVNAHQYCESVSLCGPKITENDVTFRLPTLADFSDFGIETSVDIGKKRVKDVVTIDEAPQPNCAFCKAFVKEMFKFLKNNNTEENIKNTLGKGCALIYRNEQKQKRCEELVNAYTKELVELMADETDPEVICTLLEQCVYNEDPYYKTIEPKAELLQAEPINMGEFLAMIDTSIMDPQSMKSCIQCKIFIKYLQENLDDRATIDEVKHWLKTRLCSSFDEQNTVDQCNSMVDQYGDIFFKAVVQELDPQQTCVELHACHPKQKYHVIDLLQPIAQVSTPKPKAKTVNEPGVICDRCQEVVRKIDEYASSSDIDKNVNSLIDNVCKKLPSDSLIAECTYMVETFGLTLIDAIAKAQNPEQLCKEIYLC